MSRYLSVGKTEIAGELYGGDLSGIKCAEVEFEGNNLIVFDNYHNSFWRGRPEDLYLRSENAEILYRDKKYKKYSETHYKFMGREYTTWVFVEEIV